MKRLSAIGWMATVTVLSLASQKAQGQNTIIPIETKNNALVFPNRCQPECGHRVYGT